MAHARGDEFIPAITDFVRPPFALRDDLAHLAAVWQAGAAEAAVLYATRILDVLAGAALEAVHLPPTDRVYANLALLEQYHLLPHAVGYWAHALRRLGNDVRHVRRAVTREDGELALAFLERVLAWFFCAFPAGPQLPALTPDAQPPAWPISAELRDIVARCEAPACAPTALLAAGSAWEQYLRTPALAAVLAETLLDRHDTARADALLRAAQAACPDDIRLRQLLGLACSRQGAFSQALAWLQPLYARAAAFKDEETAGIIAGVYKRMWRAGGEPRWLEQACRAYRTGWRQFSAGQNAYLGINAAATALLLGRHPASRRLAQETRALLSRRLAHLTRHGSAAPLSFWDRATLAEAHLLLGHLALARRIYRDAFRQFADHTGAIDISRAQLRELLPALGLTSPAEEWLAREERGGDSVLVGVTGHRALPESAALRAQVQAALQGIQQTAGGARLVAVSPLAEGADQLVAELVLAPPFTGDLHVVLPLEVADYHTDFPTPAARARFHTLFNQADAIHSPHRTPTRPAAYTRCGQTVVDHCQILLALWTGAPARAPGGTADTVAYAQKIGRPVVWVKTEEPFGVERL